MKKLYKRPLAGLLAIPLIFAITVCCCVEEDAFADGTHAVSTVGVGHHHGSHELAKVDHSDHQSHSDESHECTCPKHLSFLSAQSADIVFNSVGQMLAKDFMANMQFENISLLASLTYQTHGPPYQDRLDLTVPIYLEIRNLRL